MIITRANCYVNDINNRIEKLKIKLKVIFFYQIETEKGYHARTYKGKKDHDTRQGDLINKKGSLSHCRTIYFFSLHAKLNDKRRKATTIEMPNGLLYRLFRIKRN